MTQLIIYPVMQITIHPEDFKLLLDLRRFGSKEM